MKCPKCGSNKIALHMGFTMGQYECKSCGYIGPLVLEDVRTKEKDDVDKIFPRKT